jgi:predicted MFS family arabinose efflux permease
LSASAPRELSEKKLLVVLSFVQFVNVFEFMIVMPLGPDFAEALDIPMSKLGWVGGSYTLAAAVAGVVGSTFLERFGRRVALCTALAGLAIATLLATASTGLTSLLAARLVAGVLGGPATALGYAIIADAVPIERRGRAMGVVLGAFSIASVLGVPLGLELGRLFGWRMPFFVIAALTAVALLLARGLLPPLTGHLQADGSHRPARPLGEFLSDRATQLALFATAVMMAGLFAIVPHISPYFQYNLGYPRERLGLLYLVGGAVSFVAMQLGGYLVDRIGSVGVAAVGSLLLGIDLLFGFIDPLSFVPALAVFAGMMLGSSIRAVAVSALATRVPPPHERARFLSVQSSVQHGASALGALLSSSFLREAPDHSLIGIPAVASFSLVMAVLIPPLVAAIAGQVRKREQAAAVTAR